MATDPHYPGQTPEPAEELPASPLAGTRKERIQRLQIGALGLGAMVLIVGLANIILTSAQQNQASAVPDAPLAEATQDVPPPAPRDPLADAGVVPALQAAPIPQPSPSTPDVIELPQQD